MTQFYHILQKFFQSKRSSRPRSICIAFGMCLFLLPLHAMNNHEFIFRSYRDEKKQEKKQIEKVRKEQIISAKIKTILIRITDQSLQQSGCKNLKTFNPMDDLKKVNQNFNASVSLESKEVIESEVLSSKKSLYLLFKLCYKYGIIIKNLKKYCNPLIQQIVKKAINPDKKFRYLFLSTDCDLKYFDWKSYKKESEKLEKFDSNLIIQNLEREKLTQEFQKKELFLCAGISPSTSFTIPYFNKYFNILSEISLKNERFQPLLSSKNALYTLFSTCNKYKIYIKDINDYSAPLLEEIYLKYHKIEPTPQELEDDLRMLLSNTDFNPDAKEYYTFGQEDKDKISYFHTAFYRLSLR